jgi:mitotic spindle assembly checkpoint protein MAD2
LTILVSTDEKVNSFLKNVLSQIKDWLENRKVQKLVVVLADVETKETLERWEFNVEYEKEEDKENSDANNFRYLTREAKKSIFL